MSKPKENLTFPEIQSILGEDLTNQLSKLILTAAYATDTSPDPSLCKEVLRDHLTAFLAFLVARDSHSENDETLAEAQSLRLAALIETMDQIEQNGQNQTIKVH